MKKVISIVLALIMALSVASVAVSAENAEIVCEHEYGKWIISQDETCTEDGIKYRECTKCDSSVKGHIETGFVKALGHAFGEGVVTAPTCGGKGYTTYTCANCGETKTDAETPALSHTYGEWTETKAPTCTDKGEKQKVCAVCPETAEGHILTEEIPALDHTYTSQVIAPTYTEGGYTLHTCSVCGESYKDNHTPMLTGRVESVELGEKIVIKYGEVAQITPVVSVGGTVNYTVKYESGAENVATVDENGNVTGKGMGNTEITCTVTDEYGNIVTDTVSIQVKFSITNWFQIIRQVIQAAIEIVLGGLDFTPIKDLFGGNK